MQIYILVTIWFVGLATTGAALLLQNYSHYALVGAIGWTIVAASSGMLFYEIKKIRAEDKKKEMA